VREAYEETGVQVAVERLAGVALRGITYPHGDVSQYLTVWFRCRPVGGEAVVNDEESTAVGCYSPAQFAWRRCRRSLREQAGDYSEGAHKALNSRKTAARIWHRQPIAATGGRIPPARRRAAQSTYPLVRSCIASLRPTPGQHQGRISRRLPHRRHRARRRAQHNGCDLGFYTVAGVGFEPT
jgi:hypothetical protein